MMTSDHEEKSVDSSIRLQACQLLSSNGSTKRSVFYRSVALECLLLGELILDSETLFRGILDRDGELGGVLCSTIGPCTMERVLQSGHLETLCAADKHGDDHWTNHMARTLFLYCFAEELSQSSLTMGLQKMIDSGFTEYLISRLEYFKRRDEHCGHCRLCGIEKRFCRASIMILLPQLDDALWKKHSVDIFALSLQMAQNTSRDSPGAEEPWCTLLHGVLVRGIPASEQKHMSEVYGFDYLVALDQMQDLCLNGMQKSCCVCCKYQSEWHRLLLQILILRGGGIMPGMTNLTTAPEA
jgi:hypothetical protein